MGKINKFANLYDDKGNVIGKIKIFREGGLVKSTVLPSKVKQPAPISKKYPGATF